MNAYHTLKAFGTDEFTVSKSRFIGYAKPAETEEEALAFLREIRGKHRDARHCCYAYVIGRNAGIMRYSDDGEPGGTAGMPMMDVLRGMELVNCCVGVVRYFGGILLGTGGLVRAYTEGCKIAVQAAGPVMMELSSRCLCEVPYPLWDRVQYTLRGLPVQVSDCEYGTAVCFTLLVREHDAETALAALTRVTDGRLTALPDGESWEAWPSSS